MQTFKYLENSFTGTMQEKEIDLPVIEFKTGDTLVIDKEKSELRLLGKNQNIQLIISVNNDGIILNVNAPQLNITASEELNLAGKKVNITASEQINIKSKGNLIQEVEKNSLFEVGGTNKMIAQVQKIIATIGNAEIKANDDVRLDGERIKLNCD